MQIEKRIQDAIAHHSTHPDVPVTELARRFSVPYSRLSARMKGRGGRHQRQPSNTRFTEDQEAKLCSYIETCIRCNLAVRSDLVRGAANDILKEAYLDSEPSTRSPSGPPTVGIHWISRFMKRHGYSFTPLRAYSEEREILEDLEFPENSDSSGDFEMPRFEVIEQVNPQNQSNSKRRGLIQTKQRRRCVSSLRGALMARDGRERCMSKEWVQMLPGLRNHVMGLKTKWRRAKTLQDRAGRKRRGI